MKGMLSKDMKAFAKNMAHMKTHMIPESKKDKHEVAAMAESYHRPTVRLNAKHAPFIEGWQHEGVYTIVMRVKQVATEQTEWTGNKPESTFEIMEVADATPKGKM